MSRHATKKGPQYRREPVAVWAIVDDEEGHAVVALVSGGGYGLVQPEGDGYLVHEADMERCQCRGPLAQERDAGDWCTKCPGVIGS